MRLKVAAIALMLSASGAVAQMPEIYVGVHGGKSFGLGELDFGGGGLVIDGLGADGWAGGVHAGADFKLPGANMFVGGFGGYTWQNTEFEISSNGNSVFTAAFGDSWNVGGRVGTYVGQAKVYIGGGYRQTDLDIAGLGWTLKGYDAIIGAAVPVAKNVDLGIEGVWTLYDKINLGQNLELEAQQLSVMGRLTFNLGGPESVFPRASEPVAAEAAAPVSRGPCDPKLANCKK